MNAKEALKTIETTLRTFDVIRHDLFPVNSKEIECLKSALNQLEELEKENKKLKTSNKVYKRNHEQELIYIAELKKVLKIIKEKGVAVGFIQLLLTENCGGLREYNDYIGDRKLYLTETEFNLLKEYLK